MPQHEQALVALREDRELLRRLRAWDMFTGLHPVADAGYWCGCINERIDAISAAIAALEAEQAEVAAAGDTLLNDIKTALEAEQEPSGCCYDCGRKYGDEHGFPDLVIADSAWQKIAPKESGGGLLCPSCICGRLQRAGIETAGRFMSGPLREAEREPNKFSEIRSVLEYFTRNCDDTNGMLDGEKALDALDSLTAEHDALAAKCERLEGELAECRKYHLPRIEELERLGLDAQHRNADLAVIIGDIEQCRFIEADSITILCDNPEAEHADSQAAVEACGDYTGYEPQRFYGRTWDEALHLAANCSRRHYSENDEQE